MSRLLPQPLLCWICLLATVFAGAVLRGGFVVCTDAHGGTRLEWGCLRNDRAECIDACGDARSPANDGHTGDPHPCSDEPVGEQDRQDKALAGQFRVAFAPAALPFVLAPPPPGCAAPARSARTCASIRPPDSLARLRGVIMLT